MINVALVKPPLTGHLFRGTGVYINNLFQVLRKRNDFLISLVDYSTPIDKFDLVHYPYFDPFFLTLPTFKKKPTVITVHDLIPLKYPKFFPRGIKGEIKWQVQKFFLRRADVIITDSEASKKDVEKFVGVSKKKISVVYLGVSHDFFVINSQRKLNEVKTKYEINGDFILHVGDLNYNKNIPGLLKAFRLILYRFPNLQLILVGKGFVVSSSQLTELNNLIEKLEIKKNISKLGYIPLTDLVSLFNLAQVYIQVSFAEGFGLPVLEAMACGCPVVVSDRSSLPEVVGKAGCFVDPDKYEKIAEVVSEIVNSPSIRREMIKKGLERVKKFNWESTAEKTFRLYQNVLSKYK